MKRYEKQQEEIQHIKQFIASCGTYSNLVRQAKSRQKVLDKMIADGLIEKPAETKAVKFVFPSCGKLAPPVLAFYDVAFSYSGLRKDFLYSKLNLSVDLDSRIALVGPNGAGKSTLLKLMLGELQPVEGNVRRHVDLRIAQYEQHSMEQLDEKLNCIQFMMREFPNKKDMDFDAWRAHVGKFGISGGVQTTPMGKLSDGQKSRIVFGYLATKTPHLLLLDEPTNHLDMEAIDGLAKAINAFEGGLVLVSHDFRLISQVVREGQIWLCDNHTVQPWRGDIRSYKNSLVRQMQQQERSMAATFAKMNSS